MSILGFAWYYVVIFLVVLTIVVYVHEWGHYWVARRNDVRVEVFSIGFGPEVFGWNDAKGTRWKVSAIPLGGYVRMFGEGDTLEEEDGAERTLTPEERAVSFHHKRLGQRAAIVAAGPVVNFLFAMVVMAVVALSYGVPSFDVGVGGVRAGSAAAEAGLAEGDVIVSVDGAEVRGFEDVQQAVAAKPGQPLVIEVRRGGVIERVTAVPHAVGGDVGAPRGQLGIEMRPVDFTYERKGPVAALWYGVEYTVGMIGRILVVLGDVIAGNRSPEDLGGPLGIAQVTGQAAQGGLLNLVILMAMLSINLGLINLFPIPMLDGGHLAFYVLEAFRGRPLGPRAQEYGFRFGLILVLILIVFATWQDLRRMQVIDFIKDLVT